MSNWIRAADAAAEVGLTTGRIYQMVSAGTLPAQRVGRSIRIPRDAWEKWRRENVREVVPTSDATPAGAGR
jgi:excisionase family DNA binding protein